MCIENKCETLISYKLSRKKDVEGKTNRFIKSLGTTEIIQSQEIFGLHRVQEHLRF